MKLHLFCFLTLLIFTIPLSASGEGKSGDACEAFRTQMRPLRSSHHELHKKLRDRDKELERLRDAVALREGRLSDVGAHRALVMGQKVMKVGAAQLRLLEMVRESLSKKPEGPEINQQEIKAVLDRKVEEQKRLNLFVTGDELREQQKEIEKLKSLDLSNAKDREAAIEKEIEPLEQEISKSEDRIAAVRDGAEKSGCYDSEPHPLKTREENADKQKCDRLRELAKSSQKKYFDALGAESRFFREYAEFDFVRKASKDDHIFEVAEKVLRQISAELAVEREKVVILTAATKNPKLRAELEPLADAEPGQGQVAYLQSQLERNRREYMRVKNAVAGLKKKSSDDLREATSGLENKKTALSNAAESAKSEYEKAKEPFKKAGCRESFMDLLTMVTIMNVFDKGHSRLWDGVPEFGDFGWPAQPIQAVPPPPGPAPGTTR